MEAEFETSINIKRRSIIREKKKKKYDIKVKIHKCTFDSHQI